MGTLQVDNIKSTTITENVASPITLSGNNATLTSNVVFPAGHVIDVQSNFINPAGSHVITNSGNQATNSDSLTNVLTSRRVFSKVLSVTCNVASGNKLALFCQMGSHDNMSMSSTGAYGFTFKVPDASGNNRGYDGTRYPHYQANTVAPYGYDMSGSILVGEESGDTIATGDIEVSLYAFAYSEGNTQTVTIGKTYLIAMEIQG